MIRILVESSSLILILTEMLSFSVWHATINPTSSILATGCVEVVGCVKCEELACWKEVPEGVGILEIYFCFLLPPVPFVN